MGEINYSQIITALISGVLGGILVTIVNYLFTRKKTNEEINKLRAEVRNLDKNTDKQQTEINLMTQKLNTLVVDELKPWVRYFDQEPQLFLGSKQTEFGIKSDFISFEQCTILLWVKIPVKGQGLRSKGQFRYLLAHITGGVPPNGWPHYNRFSLGHSDNGRWAMSYSASDAVEQSLTIVDELETGWHQFSIAWDRTKPLLEFMIDGGKNGRKFDDNFLAHWPQALRKDTFIGYWNPEWREGYCDTLIYQFAIYNKYINESHPVFLEHRRLGEHLAS